MQKLSDAQIQSFKNAFANRMRDWRHRRGMSQAEVAERCGLSQYVISFYERGGRVPSYITTLKLCIGLGLTPNELYGYDKK